MARSVRLPAERLDPHLLPVEMPPTGRAPSETAQEDPPAPLVWNQVFGNDHPVELEIGFGKGLFLTNAASAHPTRNYLGVEIERKYVLLTATRLARRGLTNVKLTCTDARWFLSAKVPEGSLAGVHLYFPDPWWKRRHRKRRVFTPEFAHRCSQVLEPGGRLHFATDVQGYYEESLKIVGKVNCLVPLPPPPEQPPSHEMDYLTNFERKFRKAELPIYRAIWERAR